MAEDTVHGQVNRAFFLGDYVIQQLHITSEMLKYLVFIYCKHPSSFLRLSSFTVGVVPFSFALFQLQDLHSVHSVKHLRRSSKQ